MKQVGEVLRLLNVPSPKPLDPWVFDIEPATNSLGIPSAVENIMEDYAIECIRRTYQPSVLRRKRRNGFLKRMSSRTGRQVLERRRQVGRYRIINM